jgi:hypothetical protein
MALARNMAMIASRPVAGGDGGTSITASSVNCAARSSSLPPSPAVE